MGLIETLGGAAICATFALLIRRRHRLYMAVIACWLLLAFTAAVFGIGYVSGAKAQHAAIVQKAADPVVRATPRSDETGYRLALAGLVFLGAGTLLLLLPYYAERMQLFADGEKADRREGSDGHP